MTIAAEANLATSSESPLLDMPGHNVPDGLQQKAGKALRPQVRTGKRYRPGRAADHYDVVVVGSGIGGLANAALLSLLGKKVCVLEQHYTAGGFTHAYEREGYEWDVGVHYIGEVHLEHSPMRRLFDVVSEGRLRWSEMDPVYDRIMVGDDSVDFVAGRLHFIAELVKKFPQDEAAIRSYVALVQDVSAKVSRFFAAQAMPRWMARLYNGLRPWFLRKEYFQSTREVLENLTDNQSLISVLTGQWGDYGQVPRDSAFLMHALLVRHYLSGGAYPEGGASSIARSIIPTIESRGGDVFTYAKVERVLVRDNCAYGVLMADGSKVTADQVVSNVGLMNTVNHLLPEISRRQHRTHEWTRRVERSSASLCLYAGFQGDAETLGLDTTNLWIYPSGDHEGNLDRFMADEKAEFPLVYISFPSSKDPQWERRYPGKSTVEIVTISTMDHFERWRGSQWQQRGEGYEEYKEQLSQRLLEVLFKHRPQLRQALDYYELSSPLSTQFYQQSERGEIYGLGHFVERFQQPFLHPEMPVKNLYLTGVDVMTAGVGGGLMGGMLTTMRMLGLRHMGKVRSLLKNYKPVVPDQ
ncbi:phytoene desaturase family protein [Pseudomaricurvus albidus]|uniref:phytoene desaturase family protein n=1 Tax=Pseudomaricurvus albidus TaxID=2842452 RepID=UPI001F42A9E6|nr:NAD(P)/FAD-dependent oxidoreductase [Aestuariicella albida]